MEESQYFIAILYIVYFVIIVVIICFGCYSRSQSLPVDTPVIRYLHRDNPEIVGLPRIMETEQLQEPSGTGEDSLNSIPVIIERRN